MFSTINYIILIIPVLVNVAFVTLLERKILGYSQMRKGPNKVSLMGILQPMNDAIKLFTKELITPKYSNSIQYFISPSIALFIVMVIYLVFPFEENIICISFSVIYIYTVLSMNVYPVIVSGWSSNNKYSLIGSLRAVAQTISYEVSLALIFMFFLCLMNSLSLNSNQVMNGIIFKCALFLPLVAMWLISCVAETNRTPFDFAEGESELVSGFNIEYGSMGFALIFMAEYASIIFMSILFTSLFVSKSAIYFSTYMFISMIVFIWVWLRTTLPRYRYDKLMSLAWKFYLPMSLLMIFYCLFMVS